MRRKAISFITLIILIILLGGCWSRRELNDISIASAIGIDKSDDGYLVTAQLINPSEIAGNDLTTRVAVSTYRTTGTTIFEALRRLTLEVPRKIYLGHMRLLIISEDLSREGIEKVLDFFSREYEVRTDFYIMVAKDSMATDVLNILTPIEKIPAQKIYDGIEMAEKIWAPVKTVQLDELISCLVCIGKEPVLTGITLNGNPEVGNSLENVEYVDVPTTLRIDHIAVFKDARLVGWLNESESRGYNAITRDIKNSVVTISCDKNENVAIEVIKTVAKTKGKVENGVPKIYIEFKIEGNIGEVQCDINLTKPESISEIEKLLEEKSREYMKAAIEKAQKELKSDIFGFGQIIYREEPKAWKKLKKDWNKEFLNVEVDINTKAKIRRLGTISDTFTNVINKGGVSDEK